MRKKEIEREKIFMRLKVQEEERRREQEALEALRIDYYQM